MKYYLAIDLGASSGRHVVGHIDDGEIVLEEVYRFKTEMDNSSDGLVWNIPRILSEIKNGIRLAFEKYGSIESLAIDTWGVDYVLMNEDKEMPPYYAYRNERCVKGSKELHERISFEELYQRTGIQFAQFNTIYQLFDDLKKGRLDNATDYLMLPSYFTYKLTGVKTHEYTMESTGSLLNPFTKKYDSELLEKLGLPKYLFKDIKQPGFIVGDLLPEIQKEVGGNTKVLLCASHDTASAFESVNIDDDSLIISSGTWSLLGIKSKEPIVNKESLSCNYTNEGGVGYIRFLKNIMGLYLSNRVKNELDLTYNVIDSLIQDSKYKETFDVNVPSLIAPESMRDAILNLLKDNPPQNIIDLFASIFHSLALSYKKAIDELETVTKKKYKKIYIIGGGAKNAYLDYLVGQYTNLKVIALTMEATSLGNIKVQMKANKEL